MVALPPNTLPSSRIVGLQLLPCMAIGLVDEQRYMGAGRTDFEVQRPPTLQSLVLVVSKSREYSLQCFPAILSPGSKIGSPEAQSQVTHTSCSGKVVAHVFNFPWCQERPGIPQLVFPRPPYTAWFCTLRSFGRDFKVSPMKRDQGWG